MASFHLWDTPCLLLGIHSHSTNSTKLGSEDKKKWVWHVLHYTGLIVLRRSITSRRIQRERWLHWWFIGGREGDYRKREVNSIKQISYREAYPNRAPDRWILFRMKGCSFLMDTLLSSCTDEKGEVQGAFLTYLKKASKLRKERVWTGIFSPKPAHTSGRSPPLSKKSWVSIRIKSIQQEQTWKGWLPMQLKHHLNFQLILTFLPTTKDFVTIEQKVAGLQGSAILLLLLWAQYHRFDEKVTSDFPKDRRYCPPLTMVLC